MLTLFISNHRFKPDQPWSPGIVLPIKWGKICHQSVGPGESEHTDADCRCLQPTVGGDRATCALLPPRLNDTP